MEMDDVILTKAINSWDPVGLLAGGAPDDEYRPEILEIRLEASACKTEADLAMMIYKVFSNKMDVKLNHLTCLKQAFIITEQMKR
ncbi:hypothetical protein PAESOLCIP111_01217 [Paenibacillus solanacearum]|uniref:DUF1871 family protein n=1 Tax=Paenibacillus solanacearum TaxID=2048548 RepID=A0A916NN03_9BACL|nr:hypothetical protein [Paenibacillus solanacearum]CAG7609895.1 hypothetical protein PAESOLCIP111_01217 [Paenibacillus solanacearum]